MRESMRIEYHLGNIKVNGRAFEVIPGHAARDSQLRVGVLIFARLDRFKLQSAYLFPLSQDQVAGERDAHHETMRRDDCFHLTRTLIRFLMHKPPTHCSRPGP